MPGRGHIPYRGEPWPKYPKPRRQIRDLHKELLTDKTTIGLFLGLSIAALITGMLIKKSSDGLELGVFVIIFILGLALTAAVADGNKSINKFRDDYDFDSSILDKDHQDEENSCENDNDN